jgi:hypothetical protein
MTKTSDNEQPALVPQEIELDIATLKPALQAHVNAAIDRIRALPGFAGIAPRVTAEGDFVFVHAHAAHQSAGLAIHWPAHDMFLL